MKPYKKMKFKIHNLVKFFKKSHYIGEEPYLQIAQIEIMAPLCMIKNDNL